MKAPSLLLLAALFSPATAYADESLTPAQALSELSGTWEGKLEYRDYQSDRWFGLPQQKTIALLADGHTLFETSRYDDGPSGIVYIYTTSAVNADGQSLTSASFRKGRAVSISNETLRFGLHEARSQNWQLVFESVATDNNRPARVKITMDYNGNAYTTLKEIDFSDDADEVWIVRNRTSLKRVSP